MALALNNLIKQKKPNQTIKKNKLPVRLELTFHFNESFFIVKLLETIVLYELKPHL